MINNTVSLNGFVESLLTVGSQGYAACLGPEEHVDLPLQGSGARKEPRSQPQQLPAFLLAGPQLVVCQLLHYLTISLVSE